MNVATASPTDIGATTGDTVLSPYARLDARGPNRSARVVIANREWIAAVEAKGYVRCTKETCLERCEDQTFAIVYHSPEYVQSTKEAIAKREAVRRAKPYLVGSFLMIPAWLVSFAMAVALAWLGHSSALSDVIGLAGIFGPPLAGVALAIVSYRRGHPAAWLALLTWGALLFFIIGQIAA
jgi:hypothetical protein